MADVDNITSQESFERWQAELDELEHVKLESVKQALREAREFGDLSENAEYDSAREEQARVVERINELRHRIATARIVDTDSLDDSAVTINTKVQLEDNNGKQVEFTIVGTTDVNTLQHHISNESPAGAALIGHAVGDVVSWKTPRGKVLEYTITKISR